MTEWKTDRFRKWARISFLYFILIALLGLLLRYIFIQPLPGVNFKYFLHAHSHAAFLGWIFNALYAAIISEFVPREMQYKRKYWVLFVLLQVSVIGMLITFPINGYYRDSIIFSTLHMLLSYVFAFYVFRDCRGKTNGLGFLSIKLSLWFMIISSLGPYALGPMMVMNMSGSHWYDLAIYYYLHFQYNGWFVFAVLGLFIKMLDDKNIRYDRKNMRLMIILLSVACIPAYALSALWVPPPREVFVIGFLAAVMQIAASAILVKMLIDVFPQLVLKLSGTALGLILFALFFFVVKNVIQFLSAFEEINLLAYQVRNFVIAYLHMVFIGFCSLFLIGWFNYKKWMTIETWPQKAGLAAFIASFLLSEAFTVLYPTLLMLNIVIIPNYVLWIFLLSTGMPAGLMLMALPGKYTDKTTSKKPGHFNSPALVLNDFKEKTVRKDLKGQKSF
jgi:hypothetical protein